MYHTNSCIYSSNKSMADLTNLNEQTDLGEKDDVYVYKQSLISNDEQPVLPNRDNRYDGLRNIDIWAYGVGHFINDMTSTCWFNYLLFFLTQVVHTSAAPYAILAGQIADGIATPIVGILSDKTKTSIGQRKPWYIGGCILVVFAFLPTFQNFSKFSANKSLETIYYIVFPSLFNIGWASLQISHMSLVPVLSCSRKRRDKLNNLRNSFTFIANLVVLALGLVIFSVMSNRTLEFNLISYIVVILGVGSSIFFLWRIDEPKLTGICHDKLLVLKVELQEQLGSPRKMNTSERSIEFSDDGNNNIHVSAKKSIKVHKWYDWFKLPSFYIFGVCYMGVRLYCNVFGTLLPFYLIYVLEMGSGEADKIPFTMALVQLLVYLASVTSSFFLSKFYSRFGRKTAILLGGLLCIASAVSMFFLTKNATWPIYIVALFIGVAQSMTLSTGINLISEVIGNKGKQGAIVFGIYSLLDKFSCGIVLFAISSSGAFKSHSSQFIRIMTVIVPSSACILSCVLVYFTPIKEYNQKKTLIIKNRKSSLQQELVV